ncbi:MAG: hypothetical protein ABIG68_08285, partial [Acidobacteriota bacterium]
RRLDASMWISQKAQPIKEGEPTMALFVALGGLVGGAVVLAALRTKRNAKKTDHLTTMKIR